MERMVGNRRCRRSEKIPLIFKMIGQQLAAFSGWIIHRRRCRRRVTKESVLAVDEMLIDQQLQAPTRNATVRVVGKHETLNLLAIQNVIANKGREYGNVPVGDHYVSPGKNGAEAP